jgi:cell division protein FtsQ
MLFVSVVFYDSLKPYFKAWFPLKVIQVEAPYQHVSKQVIQSRLQPYITQSFLFIDKKAMEHALQTLPWVKFVRVSKKWPDTVVVDIKERIPIARFNESGLIDDTGSVYYPKKLTQFKLPQLIGIDGSAKDLLQDFKKMSKMLGNVSLTLDMLKKETTYTTLSMKDGFDVILSNNNSIQQLERFIRIYPELANHKSRSLQRVDLRYKHGLAAQWR